MSLFDIYKAIKVGRSDSLFATVVGTKLNKDAWKKGFNKWDEEWANGWFNTNTGEFSESATNNNFASKNYIECMPNTKYCISQPLSTQPQAYQYDQDKTFISRITGISGKVGTFTTADNCHYMKFIVFDYGKGHYDNDICINISGEHDGEYVPYNG